MEVKTFWPTKKSDYFISYLGFKLSSWLSQHYGHIQSKNIDYVSKKLLLFISKVRLVSRPPHGGYGVERVYCTILYIFYQQFIITYVLAKIVFEYKKKN